LDIDALAGHRLRNAGRGGVFGNVVRFEPYNDDFFHARLFQRGNLGSADRGALLQHQRALTQRVHGDAADRVLWARRTKLHAACSFSFGGMRSCAVISAMMETAISAGDTAPMSSPIGARIRAMSASEAPCARSRSARLACVFREPSAPI